MQPLTVHKLRACLKTASITAMVVELLIWLASRVLPISEQTLGSTTCRLASLAVAIGVVLVVRHRAQAAFDLAIEHRQVMSWASPSRPVSVMTNCPRRWLVVLHLRSTGRPFVFNEPEREPKVLAHR